MMVVPYSVVSSASSFLALGKSAWRIGIALQRLNQNGLIFDIPVRYLTWEVKSLGAECDHVYAELEEVLNTSETGSPYPQDPDNKMWNCLAMQVEEIGRTIQELDQFVGGRRVEETVIVSKAEHQRQETNRISIAGIRECLCRQTQALHTTLLLIKTVLAPSRSDGRITTEMDDLKHIVEKLQVSSEIDPQFQISRTETILMQCAREVIAKSMTKHEPSLATGSVADEEAAANSNTRVTKWVDTIQSLRQTQRYPSHTDVSSRSLPNPLGKDAPVIERKHVGQVAEEDEDDLDIDLAKAALETGARYFQAQDWEEADSLLQEALRLVQQLPKHQRIFCDLFSLHYKLAVCAYHTQEPADAEEALKSLAQQPAGSDEQRECTCTVTHLLSQLYIVMGQTERARSECEKTLNARRRLLGKQSNASMESMALMAHIYVLLNKLARAKLYLAMIPEDSRDVVLKRIEDGLGGNVQHLNFESLLSKLVPDDSASAIGDIRSDADASSIRGAQSVYGDSVSNAGAPPLPVKPSPEDTYSGYTLVSPTSSSFYKTALPRPQSYDASVQQHERISSGRIILDEKSSPRVESVLPTEYVKIPQPETQSEDYPPNRPNKNPSRAPTIQSHTSRSVTEPSTTPPILRPQSLTRQEILDNINCQPRDAIEEAVCSGDSVTLASLLNKRKHSWRFKLRGHVRPERVTALHFAALFGEIDMMRRLLSASFRVNDVPYGYSTSLTPLKFAIGARQVEMVNFLLNNNARPTESDTWATLAGQLMSASWLKKTVSDAEKEVASSRIIAIMTILLKHGWNINEPYEKSGRTVLHQAVTFWMGDYQWDLNLRAAVTAFLCERGANPWQSSNEGKTPYDLAKANGDQDLLKVLNKYTKGKLIPIVG